MKQWPFPGEAPVVRARKMCLAYRATAEKLEAAKQDLLDALDVIDRRLIAFDDPKALAALDRVQKTLDALPTVKELDDRFTDWGVDWHAEQLDHYDPDELVKPAIAAKLIHVAVGTVGALRIKGRIKGHWDPTISSTGGYRYKVRDVYELATIMPGRGRRKRADSAEPAPTDTLNDSRRGDPECDTQGTRPTTGPKTNGTPPTPPSKTGSKTKHPSPAPSSSKPSPPAKRSPGSG